MLRGFAIGLVGGIGYLFGASVKCSPAGMYLTEQAEGVVGVGAVVGYSFYWVVVVGMGRGGGVVGVREGNGLL